MGWFGRREKARKTEPPRNPEPVEPEAAAGLGDDEALYCVSCGTELGLDPEDAPNAEGPGRHLCGECYRAREFDADFEQLWSHGDFD